MWCLVPLTAAALLKINVFYMLIDKSTHSVDLYRIYNVTYLLAGGSAHTTTISLVRLTGLFLSSCSVFCFLCGNITLINNFAGTGILYM